MSIVYTVFIALLILCFVSPFKGVVVTSLCYATISCFSFGNYNVYFFLVIALALMLNNVGRKNLYKWESFPFTWVFTISILSYIISYILNPLGMHQGVSSLINRLVPYGLVYLLWLYYIPNRNNNKFYSNTLVIYITICCLIGLIEATTGIHFFDEFRQSLGQETAEILEHQDRTDFFRTQSLTVWSEAYGTIISFTVCSLIYFFLNKTFSFSLYHAFLFLLMSIGILTTNSRVIFLTFIIMCGGVFSSISKNKKLFYIFASLILLFVFFMSDVLLRIADSIIDSDSVQGSSIGMRLLQLDTTLSVTGDNLLFGNGLLSVSYFTDRYPMLYGAESIVFTSILARGIFGLLSVFLIWGHSIYYVIRKGKYYLIFMIIGFMFDKIFTLTYGLDETFYLLYLIPMLRITEKTNVYQFDLK